MLFGLKMYMGSIEASNFPLFEYRHSSFLPHQTETIRTYQFTAICNSPITAQRSHDTRLNVIAGAAIYTRQLPTFGLNSQRGRYQLTHYTHSISRAVYHRQIALQETLAASRLVYFAAPECHRRV